MINPKEVITILPKSSYMVPLYAVTDQGLEHAEDYRIDFCKGNKEDRMVNRQVGFFTETLLAVCKKYLEENNTEQLFNPHTASAIMHIKEALHDLDTRAEERKSRGVQGTYKA